LKDIAIYKLARIEQAIDDLSRAVERLEAAAYSRAVDIPVVEEDPGESESEIALRREIEGLRADYENLRTISRTISGRLDSTIDRVRGVLDAP
jgi:hypothetical protein